MSPRAIDITELVAATARLNAKVEALSSAQSDARDDRKHMVSTLDAINNQLTALNHPEYGRLARVETRITAVETAAVQWNELLGFLATIQRWGRVGIFVVIIIAILSAALSGAGIVKLVRLMELFWGN